MDYSKQLPLEGDHLEYKESSSKLSKDLWESISAFENTDGGIIVLGIKETTIDQHKTFVIDGLQNPQEILDDFWSTIGNDGKVSFNSINTKDVLLAGPENNLIEITVPEAPNSQKPVYLNKDVRSAFLRKGATDIKAVGLDMQTLLRDARNDLDTQVLPNYSIDDLNLDNVTSYQAQMSSRPRYADYKNYRIPEFLHKIGVISKDYKQKDAIGITAGGLLFFGNNNAILHAFPGFQLDFFDKSDPTTRWSKRISSVSDDLNVFSFYEQTLDTLIATAPDKFKLDSNLVRTDTGGNMQEALREGLINMLMHADYFSDSPSVATMNINYYEFHNPGKMKIPASEFFTTNASQTRNPVISKLFVQIGIGERAGQGGEKIYQSAVKNDFRSPEISTSLNGTLLRIWKVNYANSFSGEDINDRERALLSALVSSGHSLSHKELEQQTKLSRSIVSRAITSLFDKKILVAIGNARSTRYAVPTTDEQLMAQAQLMPSMVRDMLNKQRKTNKNN